MEAVILNSYENILIARIKGIFSILVARHELLRANFFMEDETVYYNVADYIDFEIECYTWKGKQSLQKFIRPFDLTQLPLFRIALFKQNEGRYYISFDIHHIICDGISLNLLLREFIELWQGNKLDENISSYSNCVAQIKTNMTDGKLKQLQKFWKEYLPGALPLLELPVDYPRPGVFNPEGALVKRVITKEQLEKINTFCYKHKVTQFIFFTAVYGLLLRMFTGQKEFVIGTPIQSRSTKESENVFGPFLNSTPIYITIDSQDTLEQYMKQIRFSCMKAVNNHEYPIESLIKDMNSGRDASRNILFDTMLDYRNDHIIERRFDDVHFLPHHIKKRNAKYDLTAFIEKYDDRVNILFEYCKALFSRNTIRNMLNSYVGLVDSISNYEKEQIKIIELLKANVIATNPSIYHGKNKKHTNSINGLLYHAMNNYHNNTAVIEKDKSITFRTLNSEANKLANWLVEKDVKNRVVVIYLSNAIERIIVLLAVIKAGGIFLLVEKDTPKIRLREMLLESNAIGIFTDESMTQMPDCVEWHMRKIDYHNRSSDNTWVKKEDSDPFYLVFTSGTTGKPKGIVISVKAISNYINWAKGSYLNEEEQYQMPLFTSVAFDLTFTSILLPLVSGNCIVLYDYINHPDSIIHIFQDNYVNIIKLTPTHIGLLLDHFKMEELSDLCVKTIIVGGENFKTISAAELHKRLGGRVDIFNEYGPAEAAIGCMIKKYNPKEQDAESVPIGVPIDNTCIKLIDSEGISVPKGAIGQICIAGDGLADGYLRQKELTKQKFINLDNKRYYLTGDYARHVPGADIIFLGRKDKQVKINGRRIELGEIERILEQYAGIYNVHVLIRENIKQEQEISAFFQCDYTVNDEQLRKLLLNHLPIYMMPKYFHQIDRIEFLTNGKLNENSLWSKLDNSISLSPKANVLSFETDKEKIVMELFRQVLGYNEVCKDTNFYYCGGDSIKAMQLRNKLRKKNYEISISDIYQQQTIRNIAEKMVESTGFVNENYKDMKHMTEEDLEDINEILSISSGKTDGENDE